jgi:hypothetical protein
MQWSSLRPFSIAVALPARAEGECFNFCYSCQIVAFSACLLLSARTRLEVELHSTFLSWPRDWFFTRLKSFAPPAQAKRLQWKMAFRLVVLKVKIVLRFMFSPNYFHSVLPYIFFPWNPRTIVWRALLMVIRDLEMCHCTQMPKQIEFLFILFPHLIMTSCKIHIFSFIGKTIISADWTQHFCWLMFYTRADD